MGKDEQVEIIKDLLLSNKFLLIFSSIRWPDTNTIQLLRKDLRKYNATIYLGKNSLVSKIAQLNLSNSLYKKIKNVAFGKIGFIFVNNEEYLPQITKIVSSYTVKLSSGDIAQEDIWLREGSTNLDPTNTGGLRSYCIPSKIYRGKIYIMCDCLLIKAGNKISKYDSIFLKRFNIISTCNLYVNNVIHLKEDYFVPKFIYSHSIDKCSLLFEKAIKNINLIKESFTNDKESNNFYIQQANRKVNEYNINDFKTCDTITNFNTIQQNTHCIYAKQALLWGNITKWNNVLSLEENCSLIFPELKYFLLHSNDYKLDGFILEIIGKEYYSSISIFEDICNKIINIFQDFDGIKEKTITSIGFYNILNISCFLTYFAPCYPSNHSRYMFNTNNNNNSCYLFLQPESSFIRRHIINPNKPLELADNPPKVCSIIRDNFIKNGRSYVFI